MSEKQTGGTAFPCKFAHAKNEYISGEEGMTLRDYFAAFALQGMLANPDCRGSIFENAKCAYTFADQMLEARK